VIKNYKNQLYGGIKAGNWNLYNSHYLCIRQGPLHVVILIPSILAGSLNEKLISLIIINIQLFLCLFQRRYNWYVLIYPKKKKKGK
jgi:hypothetical protein